MSDNEGVFAAQYLAEFRENVAGIETDLLAIEKCGAEIDEELAHRIYHAVHAIQGGAEFFNSAAAREVAQKMEDAMRLICSREMVPTPDRVSVLLRANDVLSALIDNPATGNQADIAQLIAALARLPVDPGGSTGADAVELGQAPERERSAGEPLRML